MVPAMLPRSKLRQGCAFADETSASRTVRLLSATHKNDRLWDLRRDSFTGRPYGIGPSLRSYAEGENEWAHFVAKAIEAETLRREVEHNHGEMRPAWGRNCPDGGSLRRARRSGDLVPAVDKGRCGGSVLSVSNGVLLGLDTREPNYGAWNNLGPRQAIG